MRPTAAIDEVQQPPRHRPRVRTDTRAARILEQLLCDFLATVTEQLDTPDGVVLVYGDGDPGRCGRCAALHPPWAYRVHRVSNPFLTDKQEHVVHVGPIAIQ